MRIILAGNPNAGKTTLFNALTGAHARTGNYHGVTVSVAERRMKGSDYLVCDLPGLYSLDGLSLEEKTAGEYVARYTADPDGAIVVQVIDARFFLPSLRLTRSFLAAGITPVLVLSGCEKFRKRKGRIELRAFSALTGLTAFEIDPFSSSCRRVFAEKVKKEIAALSSRQSPRTVRADAGGETTEAFYTPCKRSAGAEKAEQFLFNGVFAFAAFFGCFFLVLFFVFADGMPGAVLRNATERAVGFLAEKTGGLLTSPVAKSLVCDGFFGSLSGVLSFLPQILLLYFFLDLLEESGLMSVLAFMTDGLFSKVNLSGRAVFSVLLGFGCTAAAISSTRALSDRTAQRRTIACLYFLPCSAKLPVYLTLLSSVCPNAFLGAALLYLLGAGMGLAAAAFAEKSEESFLSEVADVCLPSARVIARKLSGQIGQFAFRVLTTVFLFSSAVWLVSNVGPSGFCPPEESFLASLCGALRFLFYPLGIDDWRAAFAAVSGFVAKENIAGTLAVLYPDGMDFSFSASCAYLAFVALMPPCISAIAACARETGRRIAWGYAAMQTVFALLCACLVRFLLGGGAAVAFIGFLFFALILAAAKGIGTARRRLYGTRRKRIEK